MPMPGIYFSLSDLLKMIEGIITITDCSTIIMADGGFVSTKFIGYLISFRVIWIFFGMGSFYKDYGVLLRMVSYFIAATIYLDDIL